MPDCLPGAEPQPSHNGHGEWLKAGFAVLSYGGVCHCSRAWPALTDMALLWAGTHTASVHRSKAQACICAHTQLGYILEAISYRPNWIKTKIKLCCLNFQGLAPHVHFRSWFLWKIYLHSSWNFTQRRISSGLASSLSLFPDTTHSPREQPLTLADNQSQLYLLRIYQILGWVLFIHFILLTYGMGTIMQVGKPKLREMKDLPKIPKQAGEKVEFEPRSTYF